MSQPRQPRGTSTGGQFATDGKGRPDLTLDAPNPDPGSSALRFGEHEHHPAPTDPTPRATHVPGVWDVARASVDRYSPEALGNIGLIGARPHLRTRHRAAAELVRADNGDPDSPRRVWLDLARNGRQVTVLTAAANGDIAAIEGRGLVDSIDGPPVLVRKGTQGARLYQLDVIAVVPGYNGQKHLAEVYYHQLAKVPETTAVTLDGVPGYESVSEPPNEIAAAYLLENPDFDGGTVPGCVFLATDQQAEDGIVNGYFWAPGGTGLYCERSSMYVDDLCRRGGRIVGYQPGAITLGDCLGSLPADRVEMYRAVQGQSFYRD